MTTMSSKPSPRSVAGKSEARRACGEEVAFVPAIDDTAKTFRLLPMAVPPKGRSAAYLKSEHGKNSVIELDLAGKKFLAMIRDYDVHPVARTLEHVDFIEVRLDRPVEVQVPLLPIGKAVGVTKGGVLRVVHRTVPVRCLPDRIPVKIEADVTALELGQHVSTQQLQLPGGSHRSDSQPSRRSLPLFPRRSISKRRLRLWQR